MKTSRKTPAGQGILVSLFVLVALLLSACGSVKTLGTTPEGYVVYDTNDSQKGCDGRSGETIALNNGSVITCNGADNSTSATPAGESKQTTKVVGTILSPDTTALVAKPPFEIEKAKDDRGRTVTAIKGFNVNEYGGSDAYCKRNGEPEMVHIGEVVGSKTEPCLSVIEWSLKVGDETILAGTYALHAGEWFYVPLAVSGDNDSPRIVGTLYIMPKGWNAHMMAANYASDRDARDGTTSFVGLSPTDPWVVSITDTLLAGR